MIMSRVVKMYLIYSLIKMLRKLNVNKIMTTINGWYNNNHIYK